MADDAELDLVRDFYHDRWKAHQALFKRRHPDASPEAHKELVETIYSPLARVSIEGFRGFAKSTYLEEAAVLRASFREFRNMVIVGSSYTRACDRLAAVKREFEINDLVKHLSGLSRETASVWQEGKIVLASGACIQALGREQSTVGIKHLDWRPDAALIDDVEDPDEVRTDAERAQTWDWFLKTFLPSLDHPLYSWVRLLGTRRGGGSLPERVEKDGWLVKKFPVEYVDEKGQRQATWPAKFPLPEIDSMRRTYRGDMHTFAQEYMCQASSEADRIFTRPLVRARERTWEACYAMIDPARTTRQQSATTGWAVWSWVRNRLVVWAADGQRLLPDEIVALCCDLEERFHLVELGFEEDGLNQWALQPLRQEATRRRLFLPLKPMRAPRGKTQFIAGLQPFVAAGEVEFAQELPVLTDQLLSFPTGDIDAPNALAYALLMRPGLPVYDAFSAEHITEKPEYDRLRPLLLVANATGALLTAILCQFTGERLVILADWVREGQPADLAVGIWQEAMTAADSTGTARIRRDWEGMLKTTLPDQYVTRRHPPQWVVPPHHAERWMNVGLLQAARQIPSETRLGGPLMIGRARLSDLLSQRLRGMPVVEIAPEATWTLRALAGGYARGMSGGRLKDEPEPGPYRVLMEGIESFLGLSKVAHEDDLEDTEQNWAYDKRGRRYRSAMPTR